MSDFIKAIAHDLLAKAIKDANEKENDNPTTEK